MNSFHKKIPCLRILFGLLITISWQKSYTGKCRDFTLQHWVSAKVFSSETSLFLLITEEEKSHTTLRSKELLARVGHMLLHLLNQVLRFSPTHHSSQQKNIASASRKCSKMHFVVFPSVTDSNWSHQQFYFEYLSMRTQIGNWLGVQDEFGGRQGTRRWSWHDHHVDGYLV